MKFLYARDLQIFAALVLSGAAFITAAEVLPRLDCRNSAIKVGLVFHPASSSHSAVRLACSGNRAVVVTDGLFYSGMQ